MFALEASGRTTGAVCEIGPTMAATWSELISFCAAGTASTGWSPGQVTGEASPPAAGHARVVTVAGLRSSGPCRAPACVASKAMGGTFADLELSSATLEVIGELGFEVPTPVQEETIPALLGGRDVIAQAPTGTGKTAAYGLPIVERLDDSRLEPQALVLVPTRELAIQVAEALHALGQHRHTVTLPIYGGQPYERQFRALKRGVQVVVATPGRLIDHLERRTLLLDTMRTVVLDEADEMLNMGFIEDIERILSGLPSGHQTALFSATLPARVQKLAGQYLNNPKRVSVAAREAVAPRVRQVYYEVAWPAKAEALARILDFEEPD